MSGNKLRAVCFDSLESPFGELLNKELAERGFCVEKSSAADLAKKLSDKPALAVLCNADRFPAIALPALFECLENGVCLLAIGAPLAHSPLYEIDGKWMTVTQALAAIEKRPVVRKILEPDVRNWSLRSDLPSNTDFRLNVFEGCLQFFSSRAGYDFICDGPVLENPFSGGEELTILEAKGDWNTRALMIQWLEKDGSVWAAKIDLEESWKRFAIVPESFRCVQPTEGRGGPDDRFNPANAVRLSLGAPGSASGETGGRLIWMVRNIGVGIWPAGNRVPEVPSIETLSPDWKVYSVVDDLTLGLRADQGIVEEFTTLKGLFELSAPVWRPRGIGCGENSPVDSRFIPLLDAHDRLGNWRGSAAWLNLNFQGRWKGSHVAALGLNPIRLTRNAILPLASLAASMAARLFSQPFLSQFGCPSYVLSPSGFVKARSVISVGDGRFPNEVLSLQVRLTQKNHRFQLADVPLDKNLSGDNLVIQFDASAYSDFEHGPAQLTAALKLGDRVVDRLSQHLMVEEHSGDTPHTFSVEGLNIVRDGRPIFFNGVNYWPKYSVGLEPQDFYAGWLAPNRYDSEIVERDLQVLESLNVNLVCIQYSGIDESIALADFLERCRHHRIFALISLSLGAGKNDPDSIADLLDSCSLPSRPEVFAYDVAPNAILTGEVDPLTKYVNSISSAIRKIDSHHLICARTIVKPGDSDVQNVFSGIMNYLDFLAPAVYLSAAFNSEIEAVEKIVQQARLQSGGKPVLWLEFGYSVWPAAADRAALDLQADLYQSFYDLVDRTQSAGCAAWWYPAGYRVDESSDFGIVEQDDRPRPAALVVKDRGARLLKG